MRAHLAGRRIAGTLGSQLVNMREPVEADVVLYFAEPPDRLYQLDQWLHVLEHLGDLRRVLLLLRHPRTVKAVAGRTSLSVASVPSFLDLMNFYDNGNFKLAIYVNNSDRNFQSLSNSRMLHVHVGHGDSDKLSSCSNQAKSYDRVFVAGPAAAARYVDGLLEFDEDKLTLVGRPQLDLSVTDSLAPSPRRTVLYAPTWEGATESNNWTSVEAFGTRIVDAVLALSDVRLVYKPHPRIASSPHPVIARAHQQIVRQIESANAGEHAAGHEVRTTGDILGMFARSDALIGDVSSVSLDFLYLRPECPIFLTDRHDDRDALLAVSPLAESVDVVDSASVGSLQALLFARLRRDDRRDDRARIRRTYFGDLAPGASMLSFLQAIDSLIETRDRLVAVRSARGRA